MTVKLGVIENIISSLNFNEQGLIPAIAQNSETGEVLMLAYMNADAIRETLENGHVCYWSRSRKTLWRKGETSGNEQHLVEFSYDCDKDTLLLKVSQLGPACHTLRRHCFFYTLRDGQITEMLEPESVD